MEYTRRSDYLAPVLVHLHCLASVEEVVRCMLQTREFL
jgi:hypothetical protein